MKQASVRCTYRYSGYSDTEIDTLRSDLDGIASLQVRPQGLPEAGGSFDMTVLVQFVGTTILGGILWDGLKVLGKSFHKLYIEKQKEHPDFFPEVDTFELRFDDLDIRIHGCDFEHGEECNFLSVVVFEHLPEIIDKIKAHLTSEPLLSADKLVIDVFEPLVSTNDDGHIGYDFHLPWKIVGVDIMGPREYDARNRSLSNVYGEQETHCDTEQG